jgi:hypothetical protein
MNSIMQDYYPTFKHYVALRDQMLDLLTDEELAFSIEGNETLGALCKTIGDTQQMYINSFKSLEMDFAYTHLDNSLGDSVGALRAWYAEMDAELEKTIAAFSDQEIAEKVVDRGDEFTLPIHLHLDVFKEALLIFYGKSRVYLKALGKEMPKQWRSWIV